MKTKMVNCCIVAALMIFGSTEVKAQYPAGSYVNQVQVKPYSNQTHYQTYEEAKKQAQQNGYGGYKVDNNNYVNFIELHKIITDYSYFSLQAKSLRNSFVSGQFNHKDSYNLLNSINFLEKEFYKLDDRTLGILKSEITRITNCFIADYEVKNTFCPTIEEENFHGFNDVINSGKIVVLNMNIAEYKNLSKIIAAYLKLDFQNVLISLLHKAILLF